ncbi:hypothetical protein [Curtobacterium sp. ZW137]|nr:hypothetical protein [Curtobacterium sp. ZW137]ROP60323.1 hypothetical protein EDF55_3331 [Curtobacterium sp. ZW137]
MSETRELVRPTRADQATRVLVAVRRGLSTATWLCDEALGVLERGAQR